VRAIVVEVLRFNHGDPAWVDEFTTRAVAMGIGREDSDPDAQVGVWVRQWIGQKSPYVPNATRDVSALMKPGAEQAAQDAVVGFLAELGVDVDASPYVYTMLTNPGFDWQMYNPTSWGFHLRSILERMAQSDPALRGAYAVYAAKQVSEAEAARMSAVAAPFTREEALGYLRDIYGDTFGEGLLYDYAMELAAVDADGGEEAWYRADALVMDRVTAYLADRMMRYSGHLSLGDAKYALAMSVSEAELLSAAKRGAGPSGGISGGGTRDASRELSMSMSEKGLRQIFGRPLQGSVVGAVVGKNPALALVALLGVGGLMALQKISPELAARIETVLSAPAEADIDRTQIDWWEKQMASVELAAADVVAIQEAAQSMSGPPYAMVERVSDLGGEFETLAKACARVLQEGSSMIASSGRPPSCNELAALINLLANLGESIGIARSESGADMEPGNTMGRNTEDELNDLSEEAEAKRKELGCDRPNGFWSEEAFAVSRE
jgi:hypothetical protein